MTDETEHIRKKLAAEINDDPRSRQRLEVEYGQVWDTQELTKDFDVEGFAAPFVVVVRKADGARGTLAFQHRPRLYFDFHKV